MESSRRAWWVVLALTTLCATTRLYVLYAADAAFDDAFITWRVARNLAEGLGAVYNRGERSQATSSLLHTLWCALLWSLAGAHGMHVDRLISVAVETAVVGLVLSDHLVPARSPYGTVGARCGFALLFSATYVCSPRSLLVIPGGLETGWFIALAYLVPRSVGQGQPRLAGLLGALAVFVRPDGALLLALGGYAAFRRGLLRDYAVCAAAVLLPGLVAQGLYYGTLVPQTVRAKALLVHSPAHEWWTLCADYLIGGRRQRATGALALLGAWAALRGRRHAALLAWGALQAAAVCTLTFWWEWYRAPVLFAYSVAVGQGAALVMGVTRIRQFPQPVALGACALVAALVGLPQLDQSLVVQRGRAVEARLDAAQDAELASYLRRHAAADAHVLVERIGRVGFATTHHYDDYPGLASPAVTAALASLGRPAGLSPWDTQALAAILNEVAPDYLLLRDCEWIRGEQLGVLWQYERVHTVERQPPTSHEPTDEERVHVLVRRQRGG